MTTKGAFRYRYIALFDGVVQGRPLFGRSPVVGRLVRDRSLVLAACSWRFNERLYSGAFADSALDFWTILRLGELRVRDAMDGTQPQLSLHDLYRREAARLTQVTVELIDQTLATPDLLSADDEAGLGEAELKDLRRMFANEVQKLEANEATIAVIGAMKSGKSTTINAIVGSEIVPSRSQPMTTFPTRVTHTPGQIEPVLRFGLAPAFMELAEEVRREAQARHKDGEDVAGRLLRAPSSSGLVSLLHLIFEGRFEVAEIVRGAGPIHDLLVLANDLTRLARELDVDTDIVTDHLTHETTPDIRVEFEHLANLPGFSGGTLSFIDTPGPDEAGHSRVLQEISRAQLRDASAIIMVINFRGVGSERDLPVQQLLTLLPNGAAERLFVLGSHYDLREQVGGWGPEREEAERRQLEDFKGTLARLLMKDEAGAQDLTRRVFPVAANKALRANQVQNAMRRGERFDPSLDWAADFARMAYGDGWPDEVEDLKEPQQLERRIRRVRQQSFFDAPMEQVVVTSLTNAPRLLVQSSLDKLRSSETARLFEMLGLRESALGKQVEELQALMNGLEADKRSIIEARSAIEKLYEKIQGKAKDRILDYFDDVTRKLRNRLDAYLKSGNPTGKDVGTEKQLLNLMEKLRVDVRRAVRLDVAASATTEHPTGGVTGAIAAALAAIGFDATTVNRAAIEHRTSKRQQAEARLLGDSDIPESLRGRAAAEFDGLPTFFPTKSKGRNVIRVWSEGSTRQEATAIASGISQVLAACLEHSAEVIQAGLEQISGDLNAISWLHLDQQWRNIQDRVAGMMDVEIAPPPATMNLSLGFDEDDIARSGENRSYTKKTKKKGNVVAKAAGWLARKLGFGVAWGEDSYEETEHEEHYVLLDVFREALDRKIGAAQVEIRGTIDEVFDDLDARMQGFVESVSERVEGINMDLAKELQGRDTEAETYAILARRISELATLALDVRADADALRREAGLASAGASQ